MLVKARGSVLAFLCAPAVAFGQAAAPTPIRLSLSESASATQRPGEVVAYTFDARAGRTYLIEVEQRDLDLTVTVASGGASQAYNSPLRRDESELIVVDAQQDEPYLVTITADEPTDASGTHEI